MKGLAAMVCAAIGLSTALGQARFDNTMSFNDSLGSPSADLRAVAWISGHWRGEAFGGTTEEVWTPPLGGTMMCAFKLVVEGRVTFYELVTIAEEDSSLIMRLKHFHPDLKGWELQNETQNFRLVKITGNKVLFDGFTFERVHKDEMNVYVVIQSGPEQKEVKFNYKRFRG
jgi:hypothetical protein